MDASLLPQFGGLIRTVLAFVVALSIIVAIHEYGHYIVGRWCGIKADVFSLGFGPVIYSRLDRHGTRWQVAALPLGGYVKFRGDANAASVGADDTTLSMTQAERAQTMTGASLWRRAATVAAGPAFNFVLSILLFAGLAMFYGRAVEAPVIGTLHDLPDGTPTLRTGDEVLAIDGVPVATIGELLTAADDVPSAPTVPYRIRRDGEVREVEAILPRPARVDLVTPGSAAWDAGLRPGDVITAVDGDPVHAFVDLQEEVAAAPEGTPIALGVWRAGDALSVALVPRMSDVPLPGGGFEKRALLGINGTAYFEPVTERAGPFESIGAGVERTWSVLTGSISALSHIVTGAISTCNLSGPIGIAETSGAAATQGVLTFIGFIAVLSAAVGMLNLFPIPVLDGGHLVFHAYEALRGRPPSDEAVRVLMTAGVAIMGALMLFALFNDLTCP